jgi:hypothetical protein
MNAEEFLAKLHRGISMPASPINVLPPEIELAASRGLKLAPAQGLSRFASAARTELGYPTADLVQLRAIAAQHLAPLNWQMAVDGFIVLEYTPALGHHSLCELCDGDWDWSETLQFRAGSGSNATRFLLFRHYGQKLRALGQRSTGLRVHSSGATLPVPPTRFLSGTRLAWANAAAIQKIPWFLIDSDGDFIGNPSTVVPAVPPFVGGPCERDCGYDYSL